MTHADRYSMREFWSGISMLLCGVLVSIQLLAQAIEVGFMKNRGQLHDQNFLPNPDVLYAFNQGPVRVHLRKDGFSYELLKADTNSLTDITQDGRIIAPSMFQVGRVDVDLIGALPNVNIDATDPIGGIINRYSGSSRYEGIGQYATVTYRNLLPGIDLVFEVINSENGPTPKYTFTVHPNADVSDIRLRISGAEQVALDGGSMFITTPIGAVIDRIPASWQWHDGVETPVNVHWLQHPDGTIGLAPVSAWDPDLPLMIDPAPVVGWGTYYGGAGYDEAYRVATGSGGTAFVVGSTGSALFMASAGSHDPTYNGGTDVFLAAFNGYSGNRIWGTYYGTSATELAWDIAVASGDEIYIATQENNNAGLVHFNGSGQLMWTAGRAGSALDQARGVTIDATGRPVICGRTLSTNFPVTTGCYQPASGGGGDDAFVACYDPTGALVYATYFGGPGTDGAYGITADHAGNVGITGATSSASGIASAGTYDPTHNGGDDIYLASFNSSGGYNWGTYLGTTQQETCRRVRTVNTNGFVVAGTTGTINPVGCTSIGTASFGADVVCAEFNNTGQLQWGKVYRSSIGGDEFPMDISVNSFGQIGMVGYAYSGLPMPYPTGPTTGCNTSTEGWALNLDGTNGNVLWELCIGGADLQFPTGFSHFQPDQMFICGSTNNYLGDLPPGAGTHQAAHTPGNWDGFIMKFVDQTVLPIELIRFAGYDEGRAVRLEWTTATEQNSDRFEVERSTHPAEGFETIGWMNAAGSSQQEQRYSWRDDAPMPGTNYYRLRAVDLDGSYTISEVVAVERSVTSDPQTLTVHPNPAGDHFRLSGPQPLSGELALYDPLGKLVRQWSLPGAAVFPLQDVPHGMYWVKLTDRGSQRIGRLVVDR